ncbi:unnamed protein product [Auanema sp. JU1783]|nr:unnamed protein product [Auanema sp. JU1783]
MARSNDSEDVEKIKKYIRMLETDDKVGKALKKLDKVEMTLDLLQKTKVGKFVNKLQGNTVHGEEAKRIVGKWKRIAKENGVPTTACTSSSDYPSSSIVKTEENPTRKRQRSSSPIIKREIKAEEADYSETTNDEVTSQSKSKRVKEEPTAFEQALASSVVQSKPKVKKVKRENILDLPEVDLNYRPLPTLTLSSKSTAPPPQEEEFNPEKMFKPRNERGKVFAGRRKVNPLSEVPSLFNMCLRIIGNNIDAIEDTGDIPFDILRPVLEKCNEKQLMYIEQRNPYLEEDSSALWEKFVTKKYPCKKPAKHEAWKDMYLRLKNEEAERLKSLSKKIGRANADMDNVQRKAMLADAKAPRDVRVRQMKNGTTQGAHLIPHALDVTKARRQIFESGSKSSLTAIPNAVLSRNSTLGSKTETKKQGPKKGALMMKTMKMLNIRRSR